MNTNPNAVTSQYGSATVYCNGSSDYVELIGRSETGGTAYGGTAETTWFQGYLVKAA
jgi:hypothetical protein